MGNETPKLTRLKKQVRTRNNTTRVRFPIIIRLVSVFIEGLLWTRMSPVFIHSFILHTSFQGRYLTTVYRFENRSKEW